MLSLKYLTLIAVNVAAISFLLAFYDVRIAVKPTAIWAVSELKKLSFVRSGSAKLKELVGFDLGDLVAESPDVVEKHHHYHRAETTVKPARSSPQESTGEEDVRGPRVFTAEELASYDGVKDSQPVYLAILGKVFDVEKGRKHYATGGYSFFAGRDATRAFVTGDFSPSGLSDDVDGLSDAEVLQIAEWVSFYERDYRLVGLLEGSYYDGGGRPTAKRKEVERMIARAKSKRDAQMKESEIFPFCNSEWHKEGGGRVWCTTKSGGIERSWTGVPRMLFDSSTKKHRCACVKNFGQPLMDPENSDGNRGDLDNPNLRQYESCPETANSCKLPST